MHWVKSSPFSCMHYENLFTLENRKSECQLYEQLGTARHVNGPDELHLSSCTYTYSTYIYALCMCGRDNCHLDHALQWALILSIILSFVLKSLLPKSFNSFLFRNWTFQFLANLTIGTIPMKSVWLGSIIMHLYD